MYKIQLPDGSHLGIDFPSVTQAVLYAWRQFPRVATWKEFGPHNVGHAVDGTPLVLIEKMDAA